VCLGLGFGAETSAPCRRAPSSSPITPYATVRRLPAQPVVSAPPTARPRSPPVGGKLMRDMRGPARLPGNDAPALVSACRPGSGLFVSEVMIFAAGFRAGVPRSYACCRADFPGGAVDTPSRASPRGPRVSCTGLVGRVSASTPPGWALSALRGRRVALRLSPAIAWTRGLGDGPRPHRSRSWCPEMAGRVTNHGGCRLRAESCAGRRCA
jgi:hypothetical protein